MTLRSSIVRVADLSAGLVLAAERYDPLRKQSETTGSRIIDVAIVASETVNPRTGDAHSRYIVLDTGDVKEGLVPFRKPDSSLADMGSAKKIVRAGDILISRLRPYLRQVGFIDEGLIGGDSNNVKLVCSTEFYVLRSRDGQSIAYLVTFFLASEVQALLSAAQEGGHHPRFNQSTLENLVVPSRILEERKRVSNDVESSINKIREGEKGLRKYFEKKGSTKV